MVYADYVGHEQTKAERQIQQKGLDIEHILYLRLLEHFGTISMESYVTMVHRAGRNSAIRSNHLVCFSTIITSLDICNVHWHKYKSGYIGAFHCFQNPIHFPSVCHCRNLFFSDNMNMWKRFRGNILTFIHIEIRVRGSIFSLISICYLLQNAYLMRNEHFVGVNSVH